MYACYYGNENLVDRIVELDPSTLFAVNNDKQTPLMIATMSGNVSIVKKTFHVSKKIEDLIFNLYYFYFSFIFLLLTIHNIYDILMSKKIINTFSIAIEFWITWKSRLLEFSSRPLKCIWVMFQMYDSKNIWAELICMPLEIRIIETRLYHKCMNKKI